MLHCSGRGLADCARGRRRIECQEGVSSLGHGVLPEALAKVVCNVVWALQLQLGGLEKGSVNGDIGCNKMHCPQGPCW